MRPSNSIRFTVDLSDVHDYPPEIKKSANAMAKNPQLLEEVYSDLQNLGVIGEKEITQLMWLIGCSRQLKEPLNALLIGPPAVGKTFLLNAVGRLFPTEFVITTFQIYSNKRYFPPEFLKHRLVLLDHFLPGNENKKIKVPSTFKKFVAQKNLFRIKHRRDISAELINEWAELPILAIIATTTQPDIFKDDFKLIRIFADDSEEQTRRVVNATEDDENPIDEQPILQKHHAFQENLPTNVDFVIPFGNQICNLLPRHVSTKHLELTLTFVKLMKTLALVHHQQREKNGNVIYVAPQDYEIAYRLLQKTFAYYLKNEKLFLRPEEIFG